VAQRKPLIKLKVVDIIGQNYTIYRARMAEMPDLCGLCDFTGRRILIREDVRGDAFHDTLQHELRHAYWNAAGLGSYFANITKLKGAKLSEAEETFIRLDTPACLATWKSAGLLRGRWTKKT
jgi:hypothetical protein